MTRVTIAGWGNYPRVDCELKWPLSAKHVQDVIDARGTIARGLGRSYGDPAVNDQGVVLDLTRLDRFLAFDDQAGLLTCEAGTSLAQIIETFAPRGFFPAITPGTKFVTVGGSIANDVHGKAHHADGCFSQCVRSFELLLASGEIVSCSREHNSDLFWANFGGMGLLGVILRATIALRRIETTYFHQRAIVVKNLRELLDAFEEHDAQYPYSVAWVDPLAMGEKLGRGVLTIGDHAKLDDLPRSARRDPLRVSPPPFVTVPFELPNLALNPLTLRILNVVLGQVQAQGGALAHYEKFFYPLDMIGLWNRGYGARGFTQYQFVIPLEDGYARLRAILQRIATSGLLPFLNVLKKFGEADGMLSFPMRGYTFAIDFPISSALPGLLAELDEMVIDAGGRVYLGKDAFVTPAALHKMYGQLDRWKEIKARVDPERVFTSNLARRVGLC